MDGHIGTLTTLIAVNVMIALVPPPPHRQRGRGASVCAPKRNEGRMVPFILLSQAI